MKRERAGIGCHDWEARLSEYLDGELPRAERLQLEDHLRACASCAALVEELRVVVARAESCARESAPADDLWPAIRPRLEPRAEGRDRVRDWFLAGWRLPAIAAAAIIVLAVVASLLTRQGGRAIGPGGAGHATATQPTVLEPSRGYYDTVAELRRVVEQRLTHDPRLVEVLDTNLAALDAAIAGYRDALAESPGDEALQKRLRQARERKVEVLRQAAALTAEAAN